MKKEAKVNNRQNDSKTPSFKIKKRSRDDSVATRMRRSGAAESLGNSPCYTYISLVSFYIGGPRLIIPYDTNLLKYYVKEEFGKYKS